MSLTEKQIYNRLNKCWEQHYSTYTNEAEWYGVDSPNIWICDIPSRKISVRLTLDLSNKKISIEEREIIHYDKSSPLNVKYGEWKMLQRYW